jgi:peptidoglycan/LPS O-acetylase OafA/YrhL
MTQQTHASRIPFLDGWRAISVFLVMIGHGSGSLNLLSAGLPDISKLGVYVFFAISGYVITRTSLAELARTGHFSQKNFMIRRALRILPPLLLYIVFIILTGAIGPQNWQAPLRALSFTCNMEIPFGSCGLILGHTWSLAFEEQFYLLFPFLFLRRFSFFALAALAFATVPLFFDVNWIGKVTYFQAIMLLALGCLYAGYEVQVDLALKKLPTILVLAIAAFSVAWFALEVGLLRLVTTPLVPIAILVLTFELPKRVGVIHGVLSSWPLTQIGLYSYSIYLWQQYFLMPGSATSITSVAISMIWVTALAAISYHTYEAIFRKLSRKLTG